MFKLSREYPATVSGDCPECTWLKVDVNFRPKFPPPPGDPWTSGNWDEYLKRILAYVKDGQDPQLGNTPGFQANVKGKTRWFNVPWMAYDPTAGELRTHYAGFFDPGFGYDPAGDHHGSRAALEVRARDVSFMVEHRQPVCKLALERTSAPAERLYGADLGSNYQGQVTMLSKHFEEQTPG